MQLLEMNPSHLPAILKIEAENQHNPWAQSEFERSIENNKRTAWVGTINTNLIGYAVFSHAGKEVELLTISIDQQFQGRGYGKQMLEACMEQLTFESVFLEVRESNFAAIALYEGLGFNEVGNRKGYYPAKSGREDAIIYAYSQSHFF